MNRSDFFRKSQSTESDRGIPMGDPDEEMKYPFLSLPNDENVFRWLSLLMMRIDRR